MNQLKNLNELIYASALGCLDDDDLLLLENFLSSGGSLNWKDLGEYQNLVALLPAIIEIENPRKELKDKVARKLYRVRDRIKKEITKESARKLTPGNNLSHTTISNEPDFESDDFYNVEEKLNTATRDFDVIKPVKKTNEGKKEEFPEQDKSFDSEEPVSEEDVKVDVTIEKEQKIKNVQHSDESIEENIIEEPEKPVKQVEENIIKEPETTLPPEVEESTKEFEYRRKKQREKFAEFEKKKEKKSSAGFVIGFVLFFIVVAGLIITYFNISNEVKEYKTQVQKLNSQIESLSMKMANNIDFERILSSKNVQIINLTGSRLTGDGYGKLILSFDESSGYLQLTQMPYLDENKAYQLWLKSDREFISLGVFYPVARIEYYPINLPEIRGNKSIEFLLTEEPAGGAKLPSRKIFLTGKLK